jgi:hypothetical protein
MSVEFICSYCGKSGYGTPGSGPMTAAIEPKGWVWNKSFGFGRKVFCSNKCLNEFNNGNASNNNSSSNKDIESNSQASEAKAQENASKWNAYAQLGTAAFSAASSTGKEVKETTDYLAKMVFSSDPEELGNQLSEICSMWGGAEKYVIKDNTDAIKKAAFEKFEFGFMKLKQIGMPHQIEFFTKKQKEMKPKRFGFF